MRLSLAVFTLLALTAVQADRQKIKYPTRCYPGTPCWPSHVEISELDRDTAGSVLQPSSVNYRSNILYANERVTKHPGLVLMAQTESDVVRGVLFARENHLLLSFRGSEAQTYDYTGRLANDGGFVIDLSSIRSAVATQLTNNVNVGYVTVGSGATWQDVYTAVEGSGRVVVGTNPSDSVLDTTLTPGISPLSRSLGLVSDNLIQARVVLADGRLATLNAGGATIVDADGHTITSTDASLFRALKGGGYNFAVPVSFEFQLHIPPVQVAGIDGLYNLFIDGTFLGRDAVKFVLRELANLPSSWGGYVMLDGAASTVDPADKGKMTVKLLHYGQLVGSNLNAISNLLNYAPTQVRDRLVDSTYNSVRDFRNAAGEEDVFDSWQNAYVGSSLIGSNVFTNNTRLDEFVDLLLGVVDSPAVDSNYRCIGRLLGGQIAALANDNDAISQTLRDASMSVTCGLMWRESMLREDYYLGHAMKGTHELRAFGNGVDLRYAPEDLEDWKTALFAGKYSSLLETKSHWDVDNFLWLPNHIASNFRLNCRLGRCRGN